MKGAAILRVLAALAVLALLAFVLTHTRWEEVQVDDEPNGAAASDPYYSLRQVLASAGATLQVRSTLEPLPPAGATLVLESRLWNIFPERDARLRAWVENGGHLALRSPHSYAGDDDLRWVPLTTLDPRRKPPRKGAAAASPAQAASGSDDDHEDDATPATQRPLPPARETGQQRRRREKLAGMLHVHVQRPSCDPFSESEATRQPAFEPGRRYRGCLYAGRLRALAHVEPTWMLAGVPGTLAMRVPVGRGTVTGVTSTPFMDNLALIIDNHALLDGDNALISAAILQATPGRAVWVIEDEAREPLLAWVWHEARTPFLLALAAIVLALWRLMVRFGPREAVPPQARRSMGEQVAGTGQFIAATDARALHAATRRAFEDVACRRVEGWAQLEDGARVDALAAAVAHSHAIDRPALLAALNLGAGAGRTQILAAIAVLEQARRALLRMPPAPFVS